MKKITVILIALISFGVKLNAQTNLERILGRPQSSSFSEPTNRPHDNRRAVEERSWDEELRRIEARSEVSEQRVQTQQQIQSQIQQQGQSQIQQQGQPQIQQQIQSQTQQQVELPTQNNRIVWASYNLSSSGSFAANMEDYGGLFSWSAAQVACPQGWRLPTQQEFESLINDGSIWTIRNGVAGRLFGNDNNAVFLLAAGTPASGPFGTIDNVGESASYWSSTPDGNYGTWLLVFNSSNAHVSRNTRGGARHVRCVAE